MYKPRTSSEEGISTTGFDWQRGTVGCSFGRLCPIKEVSWREPVGRCLRYSFQVGYHLGTYKHRTPSEEGTLATELDWQGGTTSGSGGVGLRRGTIPQLSVSPTHRQVRESL